MKKIIWSLAFLMLPNHAMQFGSAGRNLLRAVATSRFFSTVRPQLAKEHVAILDESIPPVVLDRFTKDYVNPEFAAQHSDFVRQVQKEWVKYAYLVKQSDSKLFMYSPSVDYYWHSFLLFNRYYEKFCEQFSGLIKARVGLIYHDPIEAPAACDKTCEKAVFRKAYEEQFGEFPNPLIWNRLISHSKCEDCHNKEWLLQNINLADPNRLVKYEGMGSLDFSYIVEFKIRECLTAFGPKGISDNRDQRSCHPAGQANCGACITCLGG